MKKKLLITGLVLFSLVLYMTQRDQVDSDRRSKSRVEEESTEGKKQRSPIVSVKRIKISPRSVSVDQPGPGESVEDLNAVDQPGPGESVEDLNAVDQPGPGESVEDLNAVDQSGPGENVEDLNAVDQLGPGESAEDLNAIEH
jgi:hypothetical protein